MALSSRLFVVRLGGRARSAPSVAPISDPFLVGLSRYADGYNLSGSSFSWGRPVSTGQLGLRDSEPKAWALQRKAYKCQQQSRARSRRVSSDELSPGR